MKRPFEEAADLFRRYQNQRNGSADQKEGADLYRAFTLLAEGLHNLDKRLERFESTVPDDGSSRIFRAPSRKLASSPRSPPAYEHRVQR